MIRDGAPESGGDIRQAGVLNAERHRDVANNAECCGDSHAVVLELGQCVSVEAGPYIPVTGPIGAGKHGHATDLFPVFVQGELLVVYW